MLTRRTTARLAVPVIVLLLGLSSLSVMAQGGEETTPDENRDLVIAYLDAISGNEKPPEVVDQYVAAGAVGLKEHIAMFEAAFPRYELIAEDIIAEGDKVVARITFRGTHLGEFFGIPPTGTEAETSLIAIYRIEDGKIVEDWIQADAVGLLEQLQGQPVGQDCYTSEAAMSFAERFDAIFDGPRMGIVDELFAPNFVSHLPLAPELDRQGWKDYVGGFYEGLSDLTEAVDEVIVGEDRVVLRVTYTGTHDGPLFGIPATGTAVSFPAIGLFRFDDNCQVIDNTAVVDVAELLAQVGAFPPNEIDHRTGRENVMAPQLLQVNFRFNMSRDEYEQAVGPLAPDIANAPGLRWKVWIMDEVGQEAGGIYLFDDETSMQAYIGLLQGMLQGPAFSDVQFKTFAVLEALSEITRGPIRESTISRP